MTPANNREALLWQVQMASFAVDEARLYLDTHPCDATALAQYGQMRDMRLNAVNAYNAQYGPLTTDAATANNRWAWVDNPWPWEVEV